MAGGIPKAQLMNGEGIQRALTRMAHEIMEQLAPLDNVVLVGIRRRGVPLAQRLADIIEQYEHGVYVLYKSEKTEKHLRSMYVLK